MPWQKHCAAALVTMVLSGFSASASADTPLAQRLAAIAARSGGTVGIAVIHVESGERTTLRGDEPLPLYSVFKLPLAVVVLTDIAAGRRRLDEAMRVVPADVAPGWSGNTQRWRKLPLQVTIRRLLELSLVESDNTASDKLLQLVGGPDALTRRLRELGFGAIDVKVSAKEMAALREHPNRASAVAITNLLAELQRGRLLAPAQRSVLWDLMGRSRTGTRRLRASLPAGTPVIDKTGSHQDGEATNDVGIIALPRGRGHLAVSVLIAGSKLAVIRQEQLIAEIGLAAYETYVAKR